MTATATTTSPAQPKLILYRGFPPSNSYTWSPFVTKLEFRLRHAYVPYTLRTGSTRNGPGGKIPYVDIAPLTTEHDTPQLLGDSALISAHLVDSGHLPALNDRLRVDQAAMNLGVRALCEDKLYFLGMMERWLDNYYVQRDHILGSKPWVVRVVVGWLIWRKIVKTGVLQGCGRFTGAEQRGMRGEVWGVLEGLAGTARRLGRDEGEGKRQGGPFWLLGGKEPTEVDFVVFGFVCSVLVCESCPESRGVVRGCESLMEYAGRIHDEYFADYVRWE